MSPAFKIKETGEMVLVKPNGVMEFYKDGLMENSLTLESESTALAFARSKGWKEVTGAI